MFNIDLPFDIVRVVELIIDRRDTLLIDDGRFALCCRGLVLETRGKKTLKNHDSGLDDYTPLQEAQTQRSNKESYDKLLVVKFCKKKIVNELINCKDTKAIKVMEL